MTPAEHARQKAWVQASEMRCPTQTQCHGVYARRVNRAAPVVFPPAPPAHVFVTPMVTELRP